MVNKNISSSENLSAEFGRTYGRQGYDHLTDDNRYDLYGNKVDHWRDKPIPAIAEYAVKVAMMAEGKYEINVSQATVALIDVLKSEVPALGDL